MNITLLFIGDIVGKAGRHAVKSLLQEIVREFQVDVVIANGENAAGGVGITPKIAEELFTSGIHVLTSGNHVWQKKEIIDYIQHERRLIRPLNFPPETPGMGTCVVHTGSGETIAVLNLIGRVFMDGFSCPFRAADQEIQRLKDSGAAIIVDFHAEATSEKQALAWYLDGKVAAVLGTHTHVQTADERILPRGTAYITDVGMTGAMDSVIGVETERVIQKFLTYLPVRFESAAHNPCLHGVLVTLDAAQRRAVHISRLRRFLLPGEA
ncbi:hypothetical protein U27_01655 [Candidatus Vecturithrix granuli]|uniref:Metallophosphoesterase n=1 Tax=Vecturithrix granuli TaxID=1499967 RepID=A0A0S6W9F7_VECG1|nr:hypothetical protein U27_01655 [Candidatus Vecturithrix granuli]